MWECECGYRPQEKSTRKSRMVVHGRACVVPITQAVVFTMPQMRNTGARLLDYLGAAHSAMR